MDYFRIAENPGTILPCDLGTRCLTATTRKDLRMASLPHGVEEPGDVSDIRLVVDTSPTLAWSAGPDGSADFFNQRWLDYTGLSAKQALGWGWEVAIHPDDLPRMLETFREALNSVRPFDAEGRFRRFDGEFRWFLFRASPLCDESGKVVKWYGANTDIEDRKRAEDALRSHEKNFPLLVDTIPGFVVTTKPAGEIELLNRRVLEYFDKTPEELANWRTGDAIHPDDLPLTIAALTRSTQTGESYEVEHRLRRADGEYRWFHTRGLALRDKEGRIVRWYYLPIDVDDRRRAEEALRKSEALLHEAQRLARTGSWSWDVLSGKVVSSPENARIYGFQPNEDSAAPELYFQRIHPDLCYAKILSGPDFVICRNRDKGLSKRQSTCETRSRCSR